MGINILDLLIEDKLCRINMGLTYVIPDIITNYLSWRKIRKYFKSTSRKGLEDLAKSRRFFPGNTLYWMGVNSLYLWKEQEFKIVAEVWPPIFFIFRLGHTSSTSLNSWSIQRYRLLWPVQQEVAREKPSINFLEECDNSEMEDSIHLNWVN